VIGALTRGLLFLSSYVPVFLIFSILGWNSYGYWSLVPSVVGVLGVIGILVARQWVRTTAAIPITVDSVQRKDAEALAYLVTYVLPFLDLKLEELSKVASLIILFATLAVIYINADMLHVNPTLSLLGWHIFEVGTPAGRSHMVITRRRRVLKGEVLDTITLADAIQWEKSG